MENNVVKENRSNLYGIDLIKLFFKKLKIMCVIALVGAIIGGVLGAGLAVMNTKYTAELNISVTPVDDTNALLHSLRSGRFAERLLLDDKGLPPKEKCDSADYQKALDAVNAVEALREKKNDKYVESILFRTGEIENTYKTLKEQYDEAFALLKMYKDADKEAYVDTEEHLKMIAECEEKLLAIQAKKDAYYNEHYLPATQKAKKLQEELSAINVELNLAIKAAESATEKLLESWREDSDVASSINLIKQSTTYEYFEAIDQATTDKTKEPTFVEKGYIKVSIELPSGNEEFAKELVSSYKSYMCDYVELQIEKISDNSKIDCVLIDPVISVEKSSSFITDAVKYAVVGAMILFVLTYIFFLSKMIFGAELKKKDSEQTIEEPKEQEEISTEV